jgi:serine/threonine protein kinase/lipoprotein NlpI
MPFALRAGTMITGYEIVRAIGAGGFGITYEGFNPITERRVAIKEFFPRGIASRDDATRIAYSKQDNDIVTWALKRFAESTNRLAKLSHPNIVEVLNYVADNGTGYMVMEHVEGQTLEEWLRARKSAPELVELGPIFDPIFDAIEYVHSKGLIHRDIAPDNIMIRKSDGRPVLIDFGALKIIEEHTRAHGTAPKSFGVAKMNYSPPEQTEDGAQVDPRVDIYSLAATIYRALAGKPPADSDKRKTDIALRGQDSYVPLAAASQIKVPPSFAATIDAAMSLRPNGRPSSVAEFRTKLAARETPSTPATTPIVATKPDAPTVAIAPQTTPANFANETPAAIQSALSTPAASTYAPNNAASATYAPNPNSAEAYAPNQAAADAGQSTGGYVPPGGETASVRKSGMGLAGIGAVIVVILLALGVLLHRPVLTLIDRMASTKVQDEDPRSQQQTQKQTPQKQQQQREQPQQQTQKQSPPQQQQKQIPAANEAQAAFARGNRLQQNGDHRQAIAEYNDAIRADPTLAVAYTGRGLSYYRLGDRDRAYDDYTAAIRLEPQQKRTSIPYLNRAIVQRERGNIDQAFEDINASVRLDPQLALAFNTRGNLYYDRNDYDRALADYNQALSIDPAYATGYTNRGNAYYAKRDWQRALEDYSNAVRLDPNSVAARVGRGNAYDELGDGDRAIKEYGEALRINRSYGLAYFNRARIYLNRKDFISALSDYSDAVRLEPKRAAAHQGRGFANEGLGRRDEAIKDFRQALQLNPELQRSRDALQRLGARP